MAIKRSLWEITLKESTDKSPENLLQKYSELVEADVALSSDEKFQEKEQAQKMLKLVQEIKGSDPIFYEQIQNWLESGTFSPFTFSAETLKTLADYFKNNDLEKVLAEDSEAITLLATESGRPFQQYIPSLLIANQKYKVPVGKMIRLMILEGSHGDSLRKNPYSSAIGLGQMITSTWKACKEPGLNNQSDRGNSHHQIMAMANYLNKIK